MRHTRAALSPPAPRAPRPAQRVPVAPSLADDEVASFNTLHIVSLVLFIISGFLAAQIGMSVFADVLPGYLADLGTIFTVLNAVNTTGWPPIVATLFNWLDVVLGITAIAALFGAGALLAVSFHRGRGRGAAPG